MQVGKTERRWGKHSFIEKCAIVVIPSEVTSQVSFIGTERERIKKNLKRIGGVHHLQMVLESSSEMLKTAANIKDSTQVASETWSVCPSTTNPIHAAVVGKLQWFEKLKSTTALDPRIKQRKAIF